MCTAENIEPEVQLNQTKDTKVNLKDVLILDSGSTFSVMANRNLCGPVFTSKMPIKMGTNNGTKTIREETSIPGIDHQMYFNEEGMANVLSLFDLSKQYRITFDSAIGNHFTVHTDEGNFKFRCSEEGLYYFEFSDKYKTEIGQKPSLVTTVAKNRSHYTMKQFEKAKEARRLYHNIGTPTVENYKRLLRANMIKNCPRLYFSTAQVETLTNCCK